MVVREKTSTRANDGNNAEKTRRQTMVVAQRNITRANIGNSVGKIRRQTMAVTREKHEGKQWQ